MNQINILLIGFIILASCNNIAEHNNDIVDTVATTPIPDEHNSRSALDWHGVYLQTTPCADCPGIEVRLELKSNDSFYMTRKYLERDVVLTDSGVLMWHNGGNEIHLKSNQLDEHYQVGENRLIPKLPVANELSDTMKEKFVLIKQN